MFIIQMPFEYLTIWWSDNLWPFKYQTSTEFRHPLEIISTNQVNIVSSEKVNYLEEGNIYLASKKGYYCENLKNGLHNSGQVIK